MKGLPKELVIQIYEYDDTYRKIFLHKVIPSLLRKIRDMNYNKLIQVERSFEATQNLLMNTDFPFWLFIYNRKFHTIDKKYFNHYFTKMMYHSQSLCLYVYNEI